ncbi:MAG: mechanosensitive ion channel [Candidatus Hatepunaea meridiana]|nr:mechanosensitive ion channel [Candidatus Hatepunaea meridiana]
MSIESVISYIQQYPLISRLLEILGIFAVSFVLFFITRSYLLKWLEIIVQKSKTKLDDVLLHKRVFQRFAYLVPAIIIYNFAYLFGIFEEPVKRIITVYGIWIFLLVIDALLTAWNEIYDKKHIDKKVGLKSYIQIAKIILFILGFIVIIAVLIGQSPLVLLSGIGALTAVLILVFRDTILSFIASLQISAYNLVKIGDWIEVPKFGADGDVIDIALHTVKVQNWDKTVTVIPTHKLIEESFKNWRGMTESGGRRIKRALYIDMTTIKLCDEKMIMRVKRFQLLKDFIAQKEEEILNYNREHNINTEELINGRKFTNVGIFRAYIKAYLRMHPKIHNDMTFLVRQLSPSSNGLPIEIYVFTNDIEWLNYEDIQSDIFDHIIAVIPQFDLRVFQNPTGKDFNRLAI